MIGFEEEEAEELGSHGRYDIRQMKFEESDKKFPKAQHHFWWLVHNCVAHVAIGLVPHKYTFWFHDWTSKKLNLHEEESKEV